MHSVCYRSFLFVEIPKGFVIFLPKGFMVTGTVSFVSNGKTDEYSYVYDNRRGNMNIRSLQLLSTNASTSMVGPDGKFYKEFGMFVDYYGDSNYADKWITAAAKKLNTAFSNK